MCEIRQNLKVKGVFGQRDNVGKGSGMSLCVLEGGRGLSGKS